MKRILYILCIQLLLSNDFENIGMFTGNSDSYESISMAGATTSWIKDISSIGSNPAGLSKMRGFSFDLGAGAESANVNDYSDTQFPYFAVGFGLKNPLIKGTNIYGGIGISYQSRTVNEIEGWSPTQNYEGLFNFSESAMSLAFAIDFQPVSFGFKWINYNQNFGHYGSQSSKEFLEPIAFGFQYNLNKKINFGISISKPSEIGKYDFSVARSKAGVSYVLGEDDLISLDYEKLSNSSGNISLGYNNNLNNFVSIAFGYKQISSEEDSYGQLSTGVSFKISLANEKSTYFNIAMKQNVSSDILKPYSRILYFSVSYKY